MGAKKKSVAEILELPAAEKILLVEQLWDSLKDDKDLFSLTTAQKDELDVRLKSFKKNPKPDSSWKAVKKRIKK